MNTELSFTLTSWNDHYSEILNWYRIRKIPGPEKAFLPETGYVVWYEGIPLCAGFLFKTDAKICIINHLISNPDVSGTKKWVRSEAIDCLLEELIRTASECGFKMVTAASNVSRLNERYEKLGFFPSDANETHYGRRL